MQDEAIAKPERSVGERKMVRITPERITGVVMDAYSPHWDLLRRAVAGMIRSEDGVRHKA
ncbi:hypothetical protein [Phenylobacterium aquaticum]|uniref:hypothetical protein n=1 Tax=Phenylobacterium aquaticum TaxID=1763816 RepID=UPI0026EAF0F8|nr:hypothetical protein [Phenylobacterium aquaticum]